MRLKNYTDIPDETVRAIIRAVRPAWNFDVRVSNGRWFRGRAYHAGSGYRETTAPFIVCAIPQREHLIVASSSCLSYLLMNCAIYGKPSTRAARSMAQKVDSVNATLTPTHCKCCAGIVAVNWKPNPQRQARLELTMYVYIKIEPGLWTVGFYDPKGQWHPDSDHSNREEAAQRVHYLNGGKS